jgi:diguanylate cyclase (GGDEF)-like protein
VTVDGAISRQLTGSVTTASDPDELLRRATAHLDRSEATAARDLAQQAAGGGDPRQRARAMAVLVRCHQMLATYEDGLTLAREAVDLCRQVGDGNSEARVHAAVAIMMAHAGYPADALAESVSALELADVSGDLSVGMAAAVSAGTVHYYLDQPDRSIEFCLRAIELAGLLGHEVTRCAMHSTMACAYMTLAEEARAAGDEPGALAHSATAQRLCHEAIAIARRVGHRQYEVTTLGNLAESLSFCGRVGEALELLEAVRIDPARDSPRVIAHLLDSQGSVYLVAGRYEEAINRFRESLAAAEGKASEMVAAEHLADACERNGDLRGALDYYKLFHAASKQVASEKAKRSASIAAVRLETMQARAAVEEERALAAALRSSNSELLQLSREDGLTGLANRRHLDELLAGGMSGRALLLVDVDHFKRVNDVHSHLIGDEVLRHIAALLQDGSRSGDTVARFGGEEFAVLLASADPHDATATAQRLRARIAAYDWAQVAPGLAVTVSVGVAGGEETADPAKALALADDRLYAAKRAGRDRVHGPTGSDGPAVHAAEDRRDASQQLVRADAPPTEDHR